LRQQKRAIALRVLRSAVLNLDQPVYVMRSAWGDEATAQSSIRQKAPPNMTRGAQRPPIKQLVQRAGRAAVGCHD
jgi:hypothetical protein